MNSLDIISSASTKLSKSKVTSLADGSKEAEVFGQLYLNVKQAALARYTWTFCTTTIELSQEIAPPRNPLWQYRYLLPSDYLRGSRFMDENGSPVNSTLEAGRAYTNTKRLFSTYIRDLDERGFTPQFTEYLIAKLAYEGSEPLVGEGAVSNRLAQEVQDKFNLAKTRDAMSKGPQALITQSRVNSRRKWGR